VSRTPSDDLIELGKKMRDRQVVVGIESKFVLATTRLACLIKENKELSEIQLKYAALLIVERNMQNHINTLQSENNKFKNIKDGAMQNLSTEEEGDAYTSGWFDAGERYQGVVEKMKKALQIYNGEIFNNHNCCMSNDPSKAAREALEFIRSRGLS